MNRTWLHLKSITVTFHGFSISYTLCRNWLSVTWFCISCTQHNRHICRVPHKEAGLTVSTASLCHWLSVIWFFISCTRHICWILHKKVDPTVCGSRLLKVVYARYLTKRWGPQCVGPAFLWGTRHIPPWSYDLYYFLFSQTEHAQRFFFFFWATNHLSLFISLTLTTWFTPLRFSLFSYANVFFVFVWIQNSLFFFVY